MMTPIITIDRDRMDSLVEFKNYLEENFLFKKSSTDKKMTLHSLDMDEESDDVVKLEIKATTNFLDKRIRKFLPHYEFHEGARMIVSKDENEVMKQINDFARLEHLNAMSDALLIVKDGFMDNPDLTTSLNAVYNKSDYTFANHMIDESIELLHALVDACIELYQFAIHVGNLTHIFYEYVFIVAHCVLKRVFYCFSELSDSYFGIVNSHGDWLKTTFTARYSASVWGDFGHFVMLALDVYSDLCRTVFDIKFGFDHNEDGFTPLDYYAFNSMAHQLDKTNMNHIVNYREPLTAQDFKRVSDVVIARFKMMAMIHRIYISHIFEMGFEKATSIDATYFLSHLLDDDDNVVELIQSVMDATDTIVACTFADLLNMLSPTKNISAKLVTSNTFEGVHIEVKIRSMTEEERRSQIETLLRRFQSQTSIRSPHLN